MKPEIITQDDGSFILYFSTGGSGGSFSGPIVEGDTFYYRDDPYTVKTVELAEVPGASLAFRVTVQ